MYRHHVWHHIGAWLPLIIIVVALVAAFEIWMIIDAALNKKLSDKAKAWWVAGMFIIHPFVAIAYFFTGHRKR
jgi:tetrahydromethanopterin S-methyltransferase subunit C